MKFEYNTLDYIKKIKKGNSYFHTFLENESLAAGILSFLSPCVLPIVPAYLAYMAGITIQDAQLEYHKKEIGFIELSEGLWWDGVKKNYLRRF